MYCKYGSVQESAFPFSILYNSVRSPARWAIANGGIIDEDAKDQK
jgi:hypothetical protein